MINIQKLSNELRAAGITTHGNCNSNGIVWDNDNNEIQSRPNVAAIIAVHDPTPDPLPDPLPPTQDDQIKVLQAQVKALLAKVK